MNLRRVFGVILRYLYIFRRSFDRLTDAFYWPTIDLLLWGLTSVFFQTHAPDAPKILLMVISGILLWLVVWRGHFELTINFLEEIWNKNLINIFASPLTFVEWVFALLILGTIKAFISFGFASIVAFILYKVQIFDFGFKLIPMLGLLMMTGWWTGFFVSGLIIRFGTRVQAFAWTLVMLISPFSAIYYPVSILPNWAQAISSIIPTSYVFEASREVLATGFLDWSKIYTSFAINIVLLILGIIYLHSSFRALLRKKGLVKMY